MSHLPQLLLNEIYFTLCCGRHQNRFVQTKIYMVSPCAVYLAVYLTFLPVPIVVSTDIRSQFLRIYRGSQYSDQGLDKKDVFSIESDI